MLSNDADADATLTPPADDYRMHTSCITEAERYEVPRDAVPKAGKKQQHKKRNPQQEWMDVVGTVAAAAPAHLREAMATMAVLDNIPRKPKPFANFASNSLRLGRNGKGIVDEIWNLLQEERLKRIAQKESEKQQQQQQQREEEEAKKEATRQQQQQQQEEDTNAVGEPKKSEDNDGVAPAASSSASSSSSSIDAKRVKKIAKKVLKKAPNRSMKLKALRKVLNKELGLPKSARKQLKAMLLETARASRDKLKIDGKTVTLRE